MNQNTFSVDPTGLAHAVDTPTVELADGDTFDIRIAPVATTIGDSQVRMLAYNSSIPGPTLRVRQGSEITVHVHNDADMDATVHWHGLRLDNAYDGVPHETQPPIEVGAGFTYRLRFPDAGLYWYHPHIREDYGLDMGLYGNVVVDPIEADYWPSVDREYVVTLDDVLIEDGGIVAYSLDGPTHVAMGRFGNVMLTAGATSPTWLANAGEVVRFYFTNTANTRLFNVALPGARMKRIGGDEAASYAKRLRSRRFGAADDPCPSRAERRKLRQTLASAVGAGPLSRLHLAMPDNLVVRPSALKRSKRSG